MKSYQCDFCGEIITEEEWNKATEEWARRDFGAMNDEIILIEDALDQDCFFVCHKCLRVRDVRNLKEV